MHVHSIVPTKTASATLFAAAIDVWQSKAEIRPTQPPIVMAKEAPLQDVLFLSFLSNVINQCFLGG